MQPNWIVVGFSLSRCLSLSRFKQWRGSVNSPSTIFTFLRPCCSPLMNTRRCSSMPVRAPALLLSGSALTLTWITYWEMVYYSLSAFVPESSWIFHLYPAGQTKTSPAVFCFSKGLAQGLKIYFHSQDSMHIFNFAIIKWNLRKARKRSRQKTIFSFTWLRWKYWRTETEKMPHGKIFEVYLDVVVSSASSLNHCSSRAEPFLHITRTTLSVYQLCKTSLKIYINSAAPQWKDFNLQLLFCCCFIFSNFSNSGNDL